VEVLETNPLKAIAGALDVCRTRLPLVADIMPNTEQLRGLSDSPRFATAGKK